MRSRRSHLRQQHKRMAPFTRTFDAIGTRWHIEFSDIPYGVDPARVMTQVWSRIDAFDKAYSRFRGDSLVTKISNAAGTYVLPADAASMIELYRDLYDRTNGAFTPLIGSTMSEAGYDAKYSLTAGEVHTPPAWEVAMTFDAPNLTTHAPVLLDFGAAGKGYLIDLVSDIIERAGIHTYVVDAGGDIRVRMATPLRIGLEHPDTPMEVIGVLELTDGSVCGSSGSRRAWGPYHHIIDPHTLTSPETIRATWVVASTTVLADALATCLYFVPPAALSGYAFEYLILNADHSVDKSANFPAELFLSPVRV